MMTVKNDLQGSPVDALKKMKKLRVIAENRFNRDLDEVLREREKLHSAALAAAAARHDGVREHAQAVVQRIQTILEQEDYLRQMSDEIAQLDQTIERHRQEAARSEQQRLQRRREVEEAEAAIRREAEKAEAERIEAEQKKAEREKAQQAAREQEARARVIQAQEAKAKEQQAREQQAKEAAERAVADAAAKAAAADAATKSAAQTRPAFQGDPLHQPCLEVHQRLKYLRRDMRELAKQTPQLKAIIGDTRREIRKCVGQLVVGRNANQIPTNNLKKVMRMARNDTLTPKIDVRQYIVMESLPPPTNPDGTLATNTADPQMPALFVYALNIFAKAVVSQFSNEASVDPKMADPVGVLVAKIFADRDFRWGERTLIDILIAKYHVVCPVLFGAAGGAPEHTNEGRKQLGWAREEKGGPWVSEQRHSERMTGLGAGYAAIGLRNFSKTTTMTNPYPNYKYWQSLYWIIGVPAAHATSTHYTVLKAMVQGYETRIIDLFGVVAFEAMHSALVNFPRQTPVKNPAANAVTVLPELLSREHHLNLENAAAATLNAAVAPPPAPGPVMTNGFAAPEDANSEMDAQMMQF